MNAFPLSPFLYLLMSDGISISFKDYDRISTVLNTGDDWSLTRLRGVLVAILAHNKEEAERIRRRFNGFFMTPDNYTLSTEEVRNLLEGLRRAVKDEPPIPSVDPVVEHQRINEITKTAPIPPDKARWKRPLLWCVIVTVLFGAVIAFQSFRDGTKTTISNQDTTEPTPTATPSNIGGDVTGRNPTGSDDSIGRIRPSFSRASALRLDSVGTVEPARSRHRWTDLLATVVSFLFLVLLWFGIAALVSKALRDPPPQFDPNSPRIFPFSALGEAEKPHLDGPTLDRLADSINYYLSTRPSKHLDIRRTIKETGRNAGMPALCFERQKQVRRVCIFEDSLAEPLIWNTVPQELVEGLSKRGVDVIHGRFERNLERFFLSDGHTYWLDDLDNERRDSLFLFFSDGKHLGTHRDSFALERLSRLPLVAWFDFRDRKFWDESALLIKTHGIPLYQANARGLMSAFDRFLMESATERDDASTVFHWRGFPPYTDGQLAVYIEHMLGDALVWAQVCAMIQPLSLKMAHTLRQKFQPHLRPERIERLFRLPGTNWQGSCLRFSREVIAALRGGFAARLSSEEQENILQFIQRQIQALEPPKEEKSLRRLVWEWTLRRVQLESSPDEVLPILSQLSQTPLRAEIRSDLSHLVFVDQETSASGNLVMVPLRSRPVTPKGVAYLKEFSPHIIMTGSLPGKFVISWKRVQFILRRIWRYTWSQVVIAWTWLRREHLDTATAKYKSPLDDPQRIIADPSEITLMRLLVGDIRTCSITFRSTSDLGIAGRIVSDNEWLRTNPSYCDEVQNEKAITIVVDTRTLKAGKRAGNITFIPADNSEPIDVPVQLQLYKSWRDVVIDWCKTHRPKHPVRALVSLTAVLAVLVVVTFKVLPANWPNRIYNRPPRLLSVKPLHDANLPNTMIAFEGVTDDVERDDMQYEWTSDWGTVVGDWRKPVLMAADSSVPESVKLTLTLHDSRGGYDSYSTIIQFGRQERYEDRFYPRFNDSYFLLDAYDYPDLKLLLEGLKSSDPRERWISANSLSYVTTEATEVIPALVRSLDDFDPNVTYRAMVALAHLRSKEDLRTVVETVIRRLKDDPSVNTRVAAAHALAGFASYRDLTIPALLSALQDGSGAVSTAAARSLGEIGPAAKEGLIERLRNPLFRLPVKRLAATALAGEGMERGDDITNVLIDVLNNPDNDIELRRRAAYSLAQLRPSDPDRIRQIIGNVTDKSAAVRSAVLSILWSVSAHDKLKETMLPALLEATKDGNAEVRTTALGALGNMSPVSDEIDKLLLEMLQDSDAKVRHAAAIALTHDPTRLLVPKLISILKDPNAQRAGAAEAIGRMEFTADSGVSVAEVVNALKVTLSDSDVELRRTCAYSLAKLAWLDEKATEALLNFLDDPDPYLKDAAISALWEIKGRDIQQNVVQSNDNFTKELRSALTHEVSFIRQHAAIVLEFGTDRDSSAVSDLTTAALSDTDATVANVALSAMYKTPNFCTSATQLLKSRFTSVRAKTVRGLARVDCFDKVPELTDQIVELISHDSTVVRTAAVEGFLDQLYFDGLINTYYYHLYEHDTLPTSQPRVQWMYQLAQKLLDNSHFQVRMAALTLLAAINSTEALSLIAKSLRDEDPRVRRCAVIALVSTEREAAVSYLSGLQDTDLRVYYAARVGTIELHKKLGLQPYSEENFQILKDIYTNGDSYSSGRAKELLWYFSLYRRLDTDLSTYDVDR